MTEEEKLKKRLSAMSDEVAGWRTLALWALDCHAATAEGTLHLKSLSKPRRERMENICRRGADGIEDIESGHHPAPTNRNYYANHGVGKRLRRALASAPVAKSS